MIFFNWKKVAHYSKGSSGKLVNIIKYITERPIPENRLSLYYVYSTIKWKGDSFLVNPESMLYYRHRYSDIEIADYVGFASLRPYPEYKIMGKTTLDFLAWRGKEDLIEDNRLLYIENGQLHFLYEEEIKGEHR